MKGNLLRRDIRKTIVKHCGFTFRHAVVRINGQISYFSELEMRALQLIVADMNDEEYKDFCDSTIIYNGCTVRDSDDTITILRDGRLDKPFKSGFYDAADTLSMGLLKKCIRH